MYSTRQTFVHFHFTFGSSLSVSSVSSSAYVPLAKYSGSSSRQRQPVIPDSAKLTVLFGSPKKSLLPSTTARQRRQLSSLLVEGSNRSALSSRRLRPNYGPTLYVSLRKGLHRRVVAAVIWARFWCASSPLSGPLARQAFACLVRHCTISSPRLDPG